MVLSTIVYVLCQSAFLGGIPTDMLSKGWSGIDKALSLPFKDIGTVLGLWWLGVFIVSDAMISPSGTANIYMSTTPRILYGWARGGTVFKVFTKVDEKSGIPRSAVWLSFILSIFWTLPFPSWDTLISVVSATLVLSHAIAPITAGAFRRNAPDLPRPLYLKGMAVLGPLSFIIASLIGYWSGWNTISWLLGSQIVMFVIYLLFKKWAPVDKVSFTQQVKSSLWLVFYYIDMMLISYFGIFGGNSALKHPWDLIVTAFISLAAYYGGTATCLPKAVFDDDEIETDTFKTVSSSENVG